MASSAGGTPAVPAITGRLPPTLFAPRAHFLSCNQLGGSLRNAGNGNRNACGGELFCGSPFVKLARRDGCLGKILLSKLEFRLFQFFLYTILFTLSLSLMQD